MQWNPTLRHLVTMATSLSQPDFLEARWGPD